MAQGVLDLLAPKAGERILDLGSGTGHLTQQIVDAGATVIGLDSSPEMVAAAHLAHPAVDFVLGDASQFAFDEPFDAVFSNATLHWVTQAEAAVACIAAALKPSGRFVAEFGGQGNVHRIAEATQRAIKTVTGQSVSHSWFFPSIGEYAGLLERHGFEVRSAWLFDRPTPLEGGDGMGNWLSMFGGGLFSGIAAQDKPAIIDQAVQALRATNYIDGQWMADYRRIRIEAHKV
jgi:trans-aconitate methyltransferase